MILCLAGGIMRSMSFDCLPVLRGLSFTASAGWLVLSFKTVHASNLC